MKQNGLALILILVGILIIATVAGGAYYFGRQTTPKSVQNPVVTSKTPQPTPSPGPDETANWKTYSNTKLGIEFAYPQEYELKEIDNPVASQHVIDFRSGNKLFTFLYQIVHDESVPPFLETSVIKDFNGIIWKIFTPKNGAQYCDGGSCNNLSPSDYMFKNGRSYRFDYPDELRSTIEKILSTFKFTQ